MTFPWSFRSEVWSYTVVNSAQAWYTLCLCFHVSDAQLSIALSTKTFTKKHCFAPLTRLNLIIGAGNISDVGSKPTERRDKDIIPDAAVRPSMDGRDYHTGRGGAGNAQTAAAAERKSEEKLVTEKPAIVAPVGLADKLKAMIFGGKKK